MKKIISNIVVVGAFFLVCFLLLFRTFYGTPFTDEVGYIVEVKRMFEGNRYILDDWAPYQGIFVFLIPLYYIWVNLFSEIGVILFFRIIFILFQIIVCLCSLLVIYRTKLPRELLIMPIMVLIFVPWQISQFSYNSIFLQLVELIYLLSCGKMSKLKVVLIAILSFIALACIPFFIFALPILFMGNKLYEDHSNLIIFIIVEICISLIYFGPVFISGGIENAIISFRGILNDADHEIGFFDKIVIFTKAFLNNNHIIGILFWILIIVSLLSVYYTKNIKTYKKLRCVCLIAAAILFLLNLFLFFTSNSNLTIGYYAMTFTHNICVSLALLGMVGFTGEKRRLKDWIDFIFFLMLSFCVNLASNTGTQSVAWSLILFDAWSLSFLLNNNYELDNYRTKGDSKANRTCYYNYGCVLLVFLIFFITRIICMPNEGVISSCDSVVKEGPYKGLHVSQNNYNEYLEYLKKVRKFDANESEPVLLTSTEPLFCLCKDSILLSNYAIYFNSLDKDKLYDFIEIHDDRFPKTAIVFSDEEGLADWCKNAFDEINVIYWREY